MPRIPSTPRPSVRLPLLAAALGGLLLAGPSAGTAAAAKARHAPCPTAGRTLARDFGPNLRVWRQGSTMKACSRVPGERRRVRTLGPWTSATKVATGSGAVAWTTASQTDAGLLVDAVSTVDVPSGRRWLQTSRAAVAPAAGVPASEDRVLRLITNDVGTGWVTSRGIVALAVRTVDDDASTGLGDDAPGLPYRSGRRYFLGDAGPANAAAVAKGLDIRSGGERDDCGGDDVFSLQIPGFGTRPDTAFVFAVVPVAPDPDIC